MQILEVVLNLHNSSGHTKLILIHGRRSQVLSWLKGLIRKHINLNMNGFFCIIEEPKLLSYVSEFPPHFIPFQRTIKTRQRLR